MPPKKADPKAKPGVDKGKGPGESVVPENECNYKVSMEVMHEGGHYMKIKYNWMDVKPDGTVTEMDLDTGFFKDWHLIQIEGEEAVPVEAEVPVAADPKAKAAPAKKAAGKPAPGGKVTMEEITDNRPRIMSYMKDFAEDGIPAMKISEAIAEKFTKQILRIQICSVNRETSEEGVDETIDIDISCLLFPRKTVEFEWKFDKLQTMAIHYLNIKVESDQPLLSDFLGKKLNPLQINLVAVKDIPYKVEPRFKPIYATCEFVDGQTFTTREMPQQQSCRFQQKHVFLVGKHDPVLLKEMLATRLVRVYLHDCDEFVSEDTDVKFSVGQSQFTFKDFLRHYCRELKLRADVFPMKRVEVDNTQNLDLNTTAKKNETNAAKLSPYYVQGTYAALIANLAFPIGTFQAEKLGSDIDEEEEVDEELVDETNNQEEEKEEVEGTQPYEFEDINGAIFERMIIIVPYKAADHVKAIQSTFERINCSGLGLENARYLNTKELSTEEKDNRRLDFLAGFEIMDSEHRMFVFEGLGGPGHSMDQFYQANMREKPNDKKYKMLYNPNIKFKNRIYLDFNVAIKKIRLRDTLTELTNKSDIYLRAKVPEDMYDTLQKFAEMRKQDRMFLVADFNLFPNTERLQTLERKYGDSLNYEDLHGQKQRKKRKRREVGDGAKDGATEDGRTAKSGGTKLDGTTEDGRTEGRTAKSDGRTAKSGNTRTDMVSEGAHTAKVSQANTMTAKDAVQMEDEESEDEDRGPQKRKADTEHLNLEFSKSLKQRLTSDKKDILAENFMAVHNAKTGNGPKPRLDLPDGMEVFLYGGQRNNIWDMQKEQLRKQIQADPSNFYTYSKNEMSGAFPVVNETTIAHTEKINSEARWKTKAGFDYLMKTENINEHPKKPDEAKLADLKVPFILQKAEHKAFLKGHQFNAAELGVEDFQSKVKSEHKTFSKPAFFNTVFISGDDMVKEMAAIKQKEKDDWNAKVIVKNQHFKVNTKEAKTHELDKYKSIREDPPQKKGIKLGGSAVKRMTERGLVVKKGVAQLPVAMLSTEEYKMNAYAPKPMHMLDLSMSPNKKDGSAQDTDFTRYSKKDVSGSTFAHRMSIGPMTTREKKGPLWGKLSTGGSLGTRRHSQIPVMPPINDK